MSTRNRTQLSEIMSLAWQFVKRNGYTDVGGSQNGMGKYEVKSTNETSDRSVLFPQGRRDD